VIIGRGAIASPRQRGPVRARRPECVAPHGSRPDRTRDEGVGLITVPRESALEIHPGDTVFTPAGECTGTERGRSIHDHLAIWEASDSGAEARLGRAGHDAEYKAASAKGSR